MRLTTEDLVVASNTTVKPHTTSSKFELKPDPPSEKTRALARMAAQRAVLDQLPLILHQLPRMLEDAAMDAIMKHVRAGKHLTVQECLRYATLAVTTWWKHAQFDQSD